MSRILVAYEKEQTTVSMVKTDFMKLAKETGLEFMFLPVNKVNPNHIEDVDIIILVRPTDYLSLSIANFRKCSAI